MTGAFLGRLNIDTRICDCKHILRFRRSRNHVGKYANHVQEGEISASLWGGEFELRPAKLLVGG